jgi:hypothetical protein
LVISTFVDELICPTSVDPTLVHLRGDHMTIINAARDSQVVVRRPNVHPNQKTGELRVWYLDRHELGRVVHSVHRSQEIARSHVTDARCSEWHAKRGRVQPETYCANSCASACPITTDRCWPLLRHRVTTGLDRAQAGRDYV